MQTSRICMAFMVAMLVGSVFAASQNAAEPTPKSRSVSSGLKKHSSGWQIQRGEAILLLSGSRIGVRIQDGNAILLGKAISPEQISIAAQLVTEATGAPSVFSQVKIESGPPEESQFAAGLVFFLSGRFYKFEYSDGLMTFEEIETSDIWTIPLFLANHATYTPEMSGTIPPANADATRPRKVSVPGAILRSLATGIAISNRFEFEIDDSSLFEECDNSHG